jgi:hypothetical protein
MLEFFAIAALLQLIEEFSELFVGHVGHTPLGGTPAAPTEGADGNRFCQLHPARQDCRHAVIWSTPPGSPSFAMSAAADGSHTARQSERILFGEIRSPAEMAAACPITVTTLRCSRAGRRNRSQRSGTSLARRGLPALLPCLAAKSCGSSHFRIRARAAHHWLGAAPKLALANAAYLRGGTRKPAFNRALPSRWVMSEDARLAHFYYAFGMVFLRNAYYCVFGPRRHLAEFADGLCRHGNARFHLDPHTTRQTTKSYVKGGNAFGLIFHWASSLADIREICKVATEKGKPSSDELPEFHN